ncbi:MAG: HEAT repeat domain-containing protein [Planctomycetota bacterium]|jgi:tetratricopeptide (TPR) repeat protein
MRQWILLSATAIALVTPTQAQPLDTGKWLVDLGRDYPLSPQASLSNADAEITLLFMQAATRIDPQLAEAYLWQYDMLAALDRKSQAQNSLTEYLRREPENIAAQMDLLTLNIESLQTAEERVGFCRKQLQRQDLPKQVTSHLHLRLANYYHNLGELDKAKAQAAAAACDDHLNLMAQDLLDELSGKPTTPQQQVKNILALISASPSNIALAWQLADSLLIMGMPIQADKWYQHIANMQAKMAPEQPSAMLLTARGRAMIDAGKLEPAQQYLKMAIGSNPQMVDAHILLSRIANKQDDQPAARNHLKKAGNIYKSILAQPNGRIDAQLLAEMAWFFAHYDPQPEQAEKMARMALNDQPESIMARRALGAAMRKLKRYEEAKTTLTQSANTDPFSAIELAQTLYVLGQKKQAVEILKSASNQSATGELQQDIQIITGKWQVTLTPTTKPQTDEIKSLLDAFDWTVMDFPLNPERFLSATLSMSEKELNPGQPWLCTIKIKNIGPLTITIGPRMMIDPDSILTITARGQKVRSSGPTINIQLNHKTKLKPNHSITVSQTIKLGKIRGSMIGTPQMTHDVQVTAVLNPVIVIEQDGKETCIPDLGGIKTEPLHFKRTGVVPDNQAIQILINRSQAIDIKERIAATELLAMLLAEHQHINARRLTYKAQAINAELVQSAVLARANDQDWQVRARLAETMRWFTLNKKATNIATKLISDKHWLVRGLALKTLTDHYGTKCKNVLQKYAQLDPDQWVKNMAKALLARTTPTTNPGNVKK